jgi:pilus assembly protein CpaE
MTMTHSESQPRIGGGDRDRTRCFVVGSCAGLNELLDGLADRNAVELVGSQGLAGDASAALGESKAEVVLQATEGNVDWVGELATLREHTDAPVVLVTPESSETMLEQALSAGVEDVLFLPQPLENVIFAIRKAARPGRPRQLERPARHGWLAMVFSPKGGTGKTVLATSLGAALAKFEGKRALLVDLDLQFGDSAIMLGLEPEKTLGDLVSAPGDLDSEKLAGYVSHHASGLDVLAAPLRPEDAELISDQKLARVLEVARESYEVVIVDTAPFFHGAVLTALDWTDTLIVVCGPDVTSLKNVHLGLRTLGLLSFPRERIEVVISRAHSNGGLSRSEIEDGLGVKVRAEIPHDRAVPLAVNRGVSAALSGGKGGFAGAVRELVRSFMPAAPKKRRRLFRLRGRG